MEQGGAEVVEGGEGQPQQDPEQVHPAVCPQLHRRLDEGDEGVQKHQSQPGQQHRDPGQDDAGGEEGVPEAVEVLGAEPVGEEDRTAHVEADEQTGEQTHEAAGHADGGKGGFTGHLADDHHIDGVVELLDEVAQQQRQGQSDELTGDAALGEGAGWHKIPSFSLF